MDGEAIYYGLNALSHNVIMANRKKLKNPNGLYLGVPGSGKSFSGKRELVNVFLATNDRIIILDPMGEYSPLVRQFGKDGLVVEIAPNSPHFINPMDLDLSMDDEVSPISLKCDFILSLMELIVGGKDGLQPVERTIIDRCARMVYQDLLNDPEHAPMPTLQDLYDLLCQQSEPEANCHMVLLRRVPCAVAGRADFQLFCDYLENAPQKRMCSQRPDPECERPPCQPSD